MRRLMLSTLLVLGAVTSQATPARADCLTDSVESCNEDFGGSDNYYTIAIRGWCYLIRIGLCNLQ